MITMHCLVMTRAFRILAALTRILLVLPHKIPEIQNLRHDSIAPVGAATKPVTNRGRVCRALGNTVVHTTRIAMHSLVRNPL
jgi:hypothetical protein